MACDVTLQMDTKMIRIKKFKVNDQNMLTIINLMVNLIRDLCDYFMSIGNLHFNNE